MKKNNALKLHYSIKIIGIVVLTISLFIISVFTGAEYIHPKEIISFFINFFTGKETDIFIKIIIFDIRVSRTIIALLCGMLLAISGTLFQGLFRNNLADPFGMGISSGATLGVAISTYIPLPVFFTGMIYSSTVGFFAFCGALATSILVYIIANLGQNKVSGTSSLLLTGMAIGAFFSAITTLILFSNKEQLHKIFLWTMGSFNGKSWEHVHILIPVSLIIFSLAIISSSSLDLLSTGDISATSMGVDVKKTRLLIIATASLSTACAVFVGGTIGFAGLIAPHIARIIWGPSHRKLIFASAFVGANLLLFADILARSIVAPTELPIGVVTALLGSPFFVYVLIRGQGFHNKSIS